MAYKITVKGKVQGVFFRVSTKKAADSLGIKGWVRNEPNGSVSIWAEGDESSLKRFIAWASNGPVNARVNQVTSRQVNNTNQTDFEIRFD